MNFVAVLVRCVYEYSVHTGLKLPVERIVANGNINAVSCFLCPCIRKNSPCVGPNSVVDVVGHDGSDVCDVVGWVRFVLINHDDLVGSNVHGVNKGSSGESQQVVVVRSSSCG